MSERVQFDRQMVEDSIAEMEKSYSPFAWPDDSCGGQTWYYDFHCAWVKEWNNEGRHTECVPFLRAWMDANG